MAYGDFDIKVGDEVGVARANRSYGGYTYARFGTVTKINGHGHIFVDLGNGNTKRFTKRGDSYKDEYGPSLIHAAQLRLHLEEDNRRKEISKIARDIEQTMKDGWSYSGRWHVSEDRVEKLKALVLQMEAFAK